MSIIDIILIGIALSMDACALTIANCTTYGKSLNRKKEWSMPIAFAIFQGVMPLIGYYIGSIFSSYLESISGYITSMVFYVLCFKIIFDIIKEHREIKEVNSNNENNNGLNFSFSLLLIQGLATSIDALFIGITLSLELTFSVFLAILIISIVTFILVASALLFGKYLGKIFGNYAEYVGAIILFILATKTLIEAIV